MSFSIETPIFKLGATATATQNATTTQTEENGSIFDNFKAGFTSWLNDEDKVCTEEFVDENNDGLNDNDDGKLSWKEKAESFGKGLLGIVKTAVNHPVMTGLAVAGGVALTVLTGGAAAPVLCAAGAAIGAGTIAYGGYKAATAETDAEAKQAWETMGNGAFGVAVSAASAKSALDAASKAGVILDKADDLNALQALGTCFKATPKAALTAGKNLVSNVSNIFNPGMININGSKTLVNGDRLQSASDGIKVLTQDFESTSLHPNSYDLKSVPSNYVASAVKGSSLDDTATSKLINFLSQFDDIKLEDWGSWNSLADLKLGSYTNNAYITNTTGTMEAIGFLSGEVGSTAQTFAGLTAAEIAMLAEEEE